MSGEQLTRRPPPRVLLIGLDIDGGLTRSIRRGFEALGWEVTQAGTTEPGPRLLASVAWRAPQVGVPFRRALRRACERAASPGDLDLVLVVKGPFVSPALVAWLRRRFATPVVCWNPDSPFDDAISNRGAGIPAAIASYDLYVTWADDLAQRLAQSASSVAVIPFGWDPVEQFPDHSPTPAAGRVVFIGSWDAERASAMRALADLDPLVLGGQWPSIDGLDIRPIVHGSAFRAAMTQARWSINLLRPQNRASHNMRTFEVLACGGSEVAPHTPDHDAWLAPLGVPLFSNLGDLAALLATDPPPRSPETDAWLADQTYTARVRQLLVVLDLA